MGKAKIINKKSVNSVMNERIMLANLNHPYLFIKKIFRFIVNMIGAFQDREN